MKLLERIDPNRVNEMDELFASAICQQSVFKNEWLRRYMTGFLLAAHALALRGLPVGSDDVADEYQPPNDGLHKGIPGSAIAMLREAHLIANEGRRKSSRRSANGRWVSTYRIGSLTTVERFLEKEGIQVEQQLKLKLTA